MQRVEFSFYFNQRMRHTQKNWNSISCTAQRNIYKKSSTIKYNLQYHILHKKKNAIFGVNDEEDQQQTQKNLREIYIIPPGSGHWRKCRIYHSLQKCIKIPLKIHLLTMAMQIRFGLMSLSLISCDRVVICDHELSCMTLVLSTLKRFLIILSSLTSFSSLSWTRQSFNWKCLPPAILTNRVLQ